LGEAKPQLRHVPGVARIRLQDAAHAYGGAYRDVIRTTNCFAASDLPRIVHSSDLIVLGRIKSAHSNLTPDGFGITTSYQLTVERVLKGTSPAQVNVVVPGGAVKFKDSSTAEIATPEFQALESNTTWIVFLRRSPDFYVLNSREVGLFRISSGDDVQPMGGGAPVKDMVQQIKALKKQAFEAQIMSLVSGTDGFRVSGVSGTVTAMH
jgi:hypothetical protein